MKNKTKERILSLTPISVMCCYLSMMQCEGFTAITTTIGSSVPFVKKRLIVNNDISSCNKNEKFKSQTQTYLQAPPGSGYLTEEDEESKYPDTYEPMMEYPGTMRPGRTPENQPYSSLPIQESDPDPVPWPHFQEIEWHHNWGSPHEHPIPMEEFIDMHGRWATAEMEAEMRAGARRGVRERRELEEAQKAASFILDDDEEDEEGENSGPQLDLGEGVDALIGAGAAAAATMSKSATNEDDNNVQLAAADDDDDDNFLLDLGLDETEDDEDNEEDDGEIDDDGEEPAFATGDDSTEGILEAMQSMIDAEDDTEVATDGDDNEIDIDFDDLGLNFDDEDEDDDDDVSEGDDDDDDEFVVMDDDDISMENEDLTLDEMVGNEDMGADDEFDDGGFDYD